MMPNLPASPPWTDAAQADRRDLRGMFGTFLTGVTVVATRDDQGTTRAFTANSFTSVSLDPALVLICLAKDAGSLEAFCTAAQFSINILTDDQRDLSSACATAGPAKAAALELLVPDPVPHVADALATMICTTEQLVDAGDHVILLGAVQKYRCGSGRPLSYFRGRYVGFGLALEHLEDMGAPLVVGGLVDWQGKVLLCRRPGSPHWALPQTALPPRSGHAEALRLLFARLGIAAAPAFLYSVYQEPGAATTTMIFTAPLAHPLPTGATAEGVELGFFDADTLPWPQISGDMARGLLRRFFQERQVGRLGLYCDSAEGGSVIAVTWPPQPWKRWSDSLPAPQPQSV